MIRPRLALISAGICAGVAGVSALPTLATAAPAAAHAATSSAAGSKVAHRDGVRGRLAELVAKDTGLSLDQVRTQLAAGKSLDQIAGDKAQAVKDAALDAVKTRLDKAVAKGKITAAQEAQRLEKAKAAIAKAMAAPGGGHEGVSGRLAELVAKDTGLTLDQVRTQLAAGKSLDQIAGDKAQAVKDAALDAVKTRLDKAVAKGKITAAQETQRLEKAKDAIARAMAATH